MKLFATLGDTASEGAFCKLHLPCQSGSTVALSTAANLHCEDQ